MSCLACRTIRQVLLNGLLAADRLGNALLLGDPNETLSRRTARCRRAGQRWAAIACHLLDAISPNHCAWSLSLGPSIGAEVWHWSPPAAPAARTAPPSR